MATDSNVGHPGSATESAHDDASRHTESDSKPQSPVESGSAASNEAGKKSSIVLAEDPFSSSESRLLFEAIDRLRKDGAGQDLPLPQV